MQKMSELFISKLGNQQRIIGLHCFARTINLITGKTITRYQILAALNILLVSKIGSKLSV